MQLLTLDINGLRMSLDLIPVEPVSFAEVFPLASHVKNKKKKNRTEASPRLRGVGKDPGCEQMAYRFKDLVWLSYSFAGYYTVFVC